MKHQFAPLALLVATLCFGPRVAAFGQTTYVWTNSAGGDLATAANWSPNGVPNIGAMTVMGDTMQFDGQSTGPVFATSNTGAQTGATVGGSIAGIYVHLTANQTNPVTLHTTVANSASPGIRFNSITIDAGAASLYLGKGSTTNSLDTLWGTMNPQSHDLINNSTHPAFILPDMRWRLGAGGAHTFIFSGTGDWNITNDLANTGGSVTLVAKDGPGTMRWTAGHTSFSAPTTPIASPMTLSGGTLVLHSSGLFPPTTTINTSTGALLKFDAAGGSQTIANPVNGGGNIQVNNGTLTLTASNPYTGTTTLSNGALFINGTNAASPIIASGGMLGGNGMVSAPVTLAAGATLAPGASAGAVGTFNVNSNLNLGGDVAIDINKSLAQSNDLAVVSGGLTNTGAGTVTISNLGPALLVGDKFTLFSQPLQNGAALTVTGAGAAWANNLALDGSISVTAVTRPTLNFTRVDNDLQFSWAPNFGSYQLQSQTNRLDVGLGSNWSDYPGVDTSPVTVPMDTTPGAVYFRLISPP
jgi:autotransporter-associated beta strand protein